MRIERQGFEFSLRTKDFVRKRSRGICESPDCNDKAEMVAHLTGIKLGKLLGMERDTLRSRENAEHRCWPCEQYLTWEENQFIQLALYRMAKDMTK